MLTLSLQCMWNYMTVRNCIALAVVCIICDVLLLDYLHKGTVFRPSLRVHSQAPCMPDRASRRKSNATVSGRPLSCQLTNKTMQLASSPQLGSSGPYRVAYNFVPAACNEFHAHVTLTTHATPEYLSHLDQLVQLWTGPISVAVYAPGRDFCRTVQVVDFLLQCANVGIRQRVSFHLVYHVEHPPPVGWEKWVPAEQNCSITLPSPAESYRQTNNLTYPINAARNVARVAASTKFVLASDVELRPSPGLAEQFVAMLERNHVRRLGRKAYVLPIFEVESGEKIPCTKEELWRLYRQGRAVYFHRWLCPHCQKFPGLKEWTRLKGKPGTIQAAGVARREYPYHRWEPIYIGTNQDPLYDERLSWEGKQDKMTQMHEMCLLGYVFVVLDRAFLVHSPGVKRKNSGNVTDGWRRPHERDNSRIYDVVMDEMARKYGRRNSRCRRR